MNAPKHFARIPALAAATALTVLAVSACAAATPAFNPDGLPEAQLSQVDSVCQTVMGLSPSERLTGGYWLGDSRLDYWTSRYRGCMTSLSDSIHTISENASKEQADRDCRAKGYANGSPDLALCVLRGAHEMQTDSRVTPASQRAAEPLPTAGGSLFFASGSERHRREENACAAVGIEPTGGAFDACVADLQRTFHAIDTPIS